MATASKTIVVSNPYSDDPNAGIIVAAGDPIPAGAGVINNTPNKVDAAANYDEVDAADKATAGRPATIVVDDSTSDETRAIHERVAANRNSWEQESQLGPPQERDDVEVPAPSPDVAPTQGDAKAPADMTIAELDAAYGERDGYPKSGNKADKVAFVTAASEG
jgi:hypothetical protein